jgi:outer membrane protein assembly factor BamE (lipoprotein component of BamABCDE complex)
MKKNLLIIVLCFVAACQPRVNSRGNVTVEDSFSSFVVGKTTMENVLEKCGTPSLLRSNYSWIYIGAKVEETAFEDVKLTQRFIVRMTFDQNKILKSIEKIDPKNDSQVFMDEEITNLMNDQQAQSLVKKAIGKNHK